jgi:hypothetical protein
VGRSSGSRPPAAGHGRGRVSTRERPTSCLAIPCHQIHPIPTSVFAVAGRVAGRHGQKLAANAAKLGIRARSRAKRGEPAGIRTQDTWIKSLASRRPWRRSGALCVGSSYGLRPPAPPRGTRCDRRGWQGRPPPMAKPVTEAGSDSPDGSAIGSQYCESTSVMLGEPRPERVVAVEVALEVASLLKSRAPAIDHQVRVHRPNGSRAMALEQTPPGSAGTPSSGQDRTSRGLGPSGRSPCPANWPW